MTPVAIRVMCPSKTDDSEFMINTIYVNPDRVRSIEPHPTEPDTVFVIMDESTIYRSAERIGTTVGRFS